MSKKTVDELRARYLKSLSDFLKSQGEEVLVTNSNELAIPCVDGEGEDQFVVFTLKVPSGSRDGTPYDGYTEAEDFVRHTAEKAEKAKLAAEKKAAKIAKDEAERAAKAKAKAEHEAKSAN